MLSKTFVLLAAGLSGSAMALAIDSPYEAAIVARQAGTTTTGASTTEVSTTETEASTTATETEVSTTATEEETSTTAAEETSSTEIIVTSSTAESTAEATSTAEETSATEASTEATSGTEAPTGTETGTGTETATGTETGTATGTETSSSSATATASGLPATIDGFSLLGCQGPRETYGDAFRLVLSSLEMDLNLCVASCSNRTYAGVHANDCYCSDSAAELSAVPLELCDLPCPGNEEQFCGGERTLVRRQATVPETALLAVYANPALLPTGVVAPTATVTATRTEVATATVTACASGYCGGFVFEQCIGGPRPGEVVFVIEACSCLGGWRYVPAPCSGDACGDLVVYRPVPAKGTEVVIYEPAPCSECSGETKVIFTQTPPDVAVVPGPSGVATGTGSPAGPTGVVVAGANKLAGSAAALVAGLVALLI